MRRFVRKIGGKGRKDRIANETFREKLKIPSIEATIEQGQSKWLDDIMKRDGDKIMKKWKKRGRLRKT